MTFQFEGTRIRGRTLRRLTQVTNSLFRQGFEVFIEQTPLSRLVTPECRAEIEKNCRCKDLAGSCPCGHALPVPQRVVNAVIELGPTYIKLGQIASTRPDLIPREYSEALRSLQEHVPSFTFEEVRRIVEEELGNPPETAFHSFEHKPIASASLSQVHFAELIDGTPVAVKVQRPGIQAIIEDDLLILRWLARQVARFNPRVRNLRPEEAIEEFGRWTLKELDFCQEGKTYDEFRHNFSDSEDVIFPKIYWDRSSSRCLTMERVDGMRVHEVVPKLHPHEQRRLAHRLAEIELQMLVTDAFFHADLHPGNIFFKADGRIVILDVGMVGRIDPEIQDRFLCYWVAIERHQPDRAFYHFLKMARSIEQANLEQFQRQYNAVLDAFYGAPLSERSMAQTYLEILLAAGECNVIMPSEMMLQAKAVVTAEALDLVLYPEFKFTEEARPIIARELARRATPTHIVDRVWSGLAEFLLLGESPPPGPLLTNENLDERRFRRETLKALAYTWAEEMDGKLRNRQQDMSRYCAADYWKDHPELQAVLQTVLGVLRLFSMQMDRAQQASGGELEASGNGSRRSCGADVNTGPPSAGEAGKTRYREFLIETHGQLDEGGTWAEDLKRVTRYWENEMRDFAISEFWQDKKILQAGLTSMINLLRLFISQLAQATVARQAEREKLDPALNSTIDRAPPEITTYK